MKRRKDKKDVRSGMKRYLYEVLKIKRSPEAIAMGFAIGTFIAILPTFGLGAFLGVLVVLIFKRVSKIALFSAFLIWNPFILAGLYPLSYLIGDLVLGELPMVEIELTFLEQVFIFTRRFLLGSVLLAAGFSLISYFILYYVARRYQLKSKDGGD